MGRYTEGEASNIFMEAFVSQSYHEEQPPIGRSVIVSQEGARQMKWEEDRECKNKREGGGEMLASITTQEDKR